MNTLFLRGGALVAATTFLLCSTACAQVSVAPLEPAACATDPASLTLSFDRFDQENVGWRGLSRAGCDIQAAELISAYRAANAATLPADSVKMLNWHEGQLRAAVGDYATAINLFEAVLAVEAEPSDRLYTQATLAFLRRDRAALLAASDALQSLPEPPAFARAADQFAATYNAPRPTWPPNADVVGALLTCFDKTYEEAYRRCNAGS